MLKFRLTNIVVLLLLVTGFALSGSCDWLGGGDSNGKTWMSIMPIQCLGNEWEQDWLLTHKYSEYPTVESEQYTIMISYYNDQDMTIYRVKTALWAEAVCLACDCPTGWQIFIEIDESNEAAFVEAGFSSEDGPP